MGIAQSKKETLTDYDLLTILDFMSSKYLLSSMHEEMSNLKDPKYCNNLVIITSDLLEKNFTSREIDYIYSKKIGEDINDEETYSEEENDENIVEEYNTDNVASGINNEETIVIGKAIKEAPQEEEEQQEEQEEEQQEEQEEEQQEEEQEEEQQEKQQEEEEMELRTEKILFGKKENVDQFSKEISSKNKYKCIGIAKFYVKIAHIYSAIMSTINPIYKFKDEKGQEKKIKMSELKDQELPDNVAIEPSGICDNRVKLLEENYEHLKKIQMQDKGTETEKTTDQPPPHCSADRGVDLINEPGIPELERLYYDVYDYKKGEFNDMSQEMKEQYLKDLKQFYLAFTGKELSDQDNISKFSDISLEDFSNKKYCDKNSEYTINLNASLLEKYALHIKETLRKTKENHKFLIEILDFLFGFTEDGEDIMIRPELVYNDLGEIVDNTTRIIMNIYTECEKDFKIGIDMFEALVELKNLEIMSTKNDPALEAACVGMIK